jgi:RNase P/RNase MRP subunit p29
MSKKTPVKQKRKTPQKNQDLDIQDQPSSENIIIPEKTNQMSVESEKALAAMNYFEFEQKKFFDDCYNTLTDYGADALEDIEKALTRKYQNEQDILRIKASMEKASTLFQRVVDTSYDAFELYVPTNVFALPSGFKGLVKNDRSNEVTSEDENLNYEMIRLRGEINKERKNCLTLQAENVTLRKEFDAFERSRETFDAIDKLCESDNIKEMVSTLLGESAKLNVTLNGASDVERPEKRVKSDELHAFAEKL